MIVSAHRRLGFASIGALLVGLAACAPRAVLPVATPIARSEPPRSAVETHRSRVSDSLTCSARLTMPTGDTTSPLELAQRPPMQHAAWSEPETRLPRAFATAVGLLFAQGVPDPRGCEYRAVQIAIGSVSNPTPRPIDVHAWVLPDDHSGVRWAIGWNGLPYRVLAIGDLADLADDANHADDMDTVPAGLGGGPLSEALAVASHGAHRIRSALLLRLGEVALAERVARGHGPRGDPLNPEDPVDDDPYARLALDVVWNHFDRGLRAHASGDDALALEEFRLLDRARPVVEAAIETRCARQFRTRDGTLIPRFTFLHLLPRLLADQERRAREQPLRRPDRVRSPAERIAAEIELLDEVDSRQFSQPGGAMTSIDPRVQALMLEGDRAIEPLLEAYMRDDRLTRSVVFWRDFQRGRDVLHVRTVIFSAIRGIVGVSFEARAGDDAERRANVERVRDYLREHPMDPRRAALLTLARDNESPLAWAEAAEWVATTPAESSRAPDRSAVPVLDMNAPIVPSVDVLLARRLAECDALVRRAGDDAYRAADRIAQVMSRRDPAGTADRIARHTAAVQRLRTRRR